MGKDKNSDDLEMTCSLNLAEIIVTLFYRK